MLFSPEILECDDPLFVQDDDTGEQQSIDKQTIREIAGAHALLVALLADMHSGLIRMSLDEYNSLSYKMMYAWMTFKVEFANKKKQQREQPRD